MMITRWRKSSNSVTKQECVEVGLAPGLVGVRDTKNREAGHFEVSRDAWSTFVASVRR